MNTKEPRRFVDLIFLNIGAAVDLNSLLTGENAPFIDQLYISWQEDASFRPDRVGPTLSELDEDSEQSHHRVWTTVLLLPTEHPSLLLQVQVKEQGRASIRSSPAKRQSLLHIDRQS